MAVMTRAARPAATKTRLQSLLGATHAILTSAFEPSCELA